MSTEAQQAQGFFGYRVWWPAGLDVLTPAARAEALRLGEWPDGEHVVTRTGERRHDPERAKALLRRLS